MEDVNVDEFLGICLKAIWEIKRVISRGFSPLSSIESEMRFYLDKDTVDLICQYSYLRYDNSYMDLDGKNGLLFGIGCVDIKEGNRFGIISNAVVWSTPNEIYAIIDSAVTQVSYRFMAIPLPKIKNKKLEVQP